LITNKIDAFVDRPQYPDYVLGLLREENIRLDILDIMESYNDLRISHGFPAFTGKSIGEIRIEVRNQTPLGIQFTDELVSRCITHFASLNGFKDG
jgi:hypothetical protein